MSKSLPEHIHTMKVVKAIQPYIHPEYLNFKFPVYEAWARQGGKIAKSHYPWRPFHGLAFRYNLPKFRESKDTAMLMFVEPVSISFDTWPYYCTHEIIPMIWDCWPHYYDKMEKWLRKHKVRTAIFTSSKEMYEIVRRIPNLNAMHCPEAVDTSHYDGGVELKNRHIDLLEFGRSNKKFLSATFPTFIKHICTKVNGEYIFNNQELYAAMGDAKVVIALPRSMTDPNGSGGVETLTQRYWENMLSRNVMVGHTPQELVDLIGYNPVIELENNPCDQILYILSNIESYQNLVNKNREMALAKGSWDYRMRSIRTFLEKQGYII